MRYRRDQRRDNETILMIKRCDIIRQRLHNQHWFGQTTDQLVPPWISIEPIADTHKPFAPNSGKFWAKICQLARPRPCPAGHTSLGTLPGISKAGGSRFSLMAHPKPSALNMTRLGYLELSAVDAQQWQIKSQQTTKGCLLLTSTKVCLPRVLLSFTISVQSLIACSSTKSSKAYPDPEALRGQQTTKTLSLGRQTFGQSHILLVPFP